MYTYTCRADLVVMRCCDSVLVDIRALHPDMGRRQQLHLLNVNYLCYFQNFQNIHGFLLLLDKEALTFFPIRTAKVFYQKLIYCGAKI